MQYNEQAHGSTAPPPIVRWRLQNQSSWQHATPGQSIVQGPLPCACCSSSTGSTHLGLFFSTTCTGHPPCMPAVLPGERPHSRRGGDGCFAGTQAACLPGWRCVAFWLFASVALACSGATLMHCQKGSTLTAAGHSVCSSKKLPVRLRVWALGPWAHSRPTTAASCGCRAACSGLTSSSITLTEPSRMYNLPLASSVKRQAAQGVFSALRYCWQDEHKCSDRKIT